MNIDTRYIKKYATMIDGSKKDECYKKIILLNNKVSCATSLYDAISHIKKYKEVTERLIERSLFECFGSTANKYNLKPLRVERGDRIKEERYDSWRRTGSLPDLTQPDQKYSIEFDVFSRTRRKCAGWPPRR